MTRLRRRFLVTTSLTSAWLLAAATGCDYEAERASPESGMAGEQREVADFEGGVASEAAERERAAQDVAAAPQQSEKIQDTRQLVRDAIRVAEQMSSDPELAQLMQQARGVLIVPSHTKVAAVVGVRGGDAVLLARDGEQWSDPAFYDIGAISVGPQLGVSGGEIAMLLMSEQALNAFKEEHDFSLNADAGFTLVDYSARAQASAGKDDVILWSDTEGAFAGVSLSASDITWDEEENAAFYDQMATAEDVLSGKVTSSEGDALQRALL